MTAAWTLKVIPPQIPALDMRHDPVGQSAISQPHVHPPSSTTDWASFWSGFILFSLVFWREFCPPTPSLFRARVAVLCKSVASLPSCHEAKPHHWPHTTPLLLTNVSSWNSDPHGQQLCCKGPLKAFGCAPVGFQSMEYAFISWLGVLIKYCNVPLYFGSLFFFTLQYRVLRGKDSRKK